MTTKDQIFSEWRLQKKKWGLFDWEINFSNRKRTLGHCNCSKKIISISNAYLKTNPFPIMKDTLLHEIAHALHYKKTGKTNHGNDWKKIARDVGCKPIRCADLKEVNLPSAKYIGTCPCCGNKTNLYRKVSKLYSCNICSNKFDAKFKLNIVEVEK